MHRIIRQIVNAYKYEPVKRTLHSQTRAIIVNYMSVYQQLFNLIIGWFYVLCTSCIRPEDDRFRWVEIENILEKVPDALQPNRLTWQLSW